LEYELLVTIGVTVAVVAVVGGAVFVAVADDSAALYFEHRATPAVSATPSKLAGQDAMRQDATMPPMTLCVGPHWQATSVGAQPALEMALTRQAVAQAGSPGKLSAVERARRVVRVRSWSFIVVVVLIGVIGDCGAICFDLERL
jgi:hypothetical protein